MTTLTDRIAGLNGFVGLKPPVRAATTANITLSGEQTIDDVAVVASNRVLVKDQTDGTENGIWVVASGAWSRSKDFNGVRDVVSGTQVLVTSGTVNGGRLYRISTADPITIGTTAIAFSQTVGEIAARIGNQSLYDTRAALAAATVPSVVVGVKTAGYATIGDGGGATYDRADAEPSHDFKVQSADGAWWEIVPEYGRLNVRQAGAVGDDATDDGPAFASAILGAATYNASGTNHAIDEIVVPPGAYYLGSTTLELHAAMKLVGSGSGCSGPAKPVTLRWDANVTGIMVHRGNTTGATTGTDTGSAEGSRIEGLYLVSDGGTIAGVTDITKGHGIVMRARAMLRDVRIDDFPGNGIHIHATQGSGDAEVEGNANVWQINTARLQGCHLSGVFVDGADVNAGIGINVDATGNGRWGIHDSSFLGNTWIGCHTANNGRNGKGENSGQDSLTNFGGNEYWAHRGATEAQLVATQPGTDESIWRLDGPGTGGIEWTGGQAEGTFFPGGALAADSANARNLFLGCYSESPNNEGACQFMLPTIAIGGHRLKNFGGFGIGSNNVHAALSGPVRWNNHHFSGRDRDIDMEFWKASEYPIRLVADGDDSSGVNIHWNESAGAWDLFNHSTTLNPAPAMVTCNLSTGINGGRSSALGAGHLLFNRGVFLGGNGFSNSTRHHSVDTAAPTSGDHARGEFVWNRDPSVDGNNMILIGWSCTVSGTPGTWVDCFMSTVSPAT